MSVFFFVNALKLNLSRHGQFPVSMETDRVSAESHDRNFIEKVICERKVEVTLNTEESGVGV